MDTIKNYLDNMFSAFPNTAEITKAKENFLSNMEDKYNELKQNGKSENEAIGIVISEFGNIDELKNELGITDSAESNTDFLPVITKDTAFKYLQAQKLYGNIIALGSLLCILAPSVFILLSSMADSRNLPDRVETLALFPLFVLIATAVSLFIFSGFQLEKFEYLKDPFQLDFGLKELILRKKEAFMPVFAIHIIMGVVLCILSPLTVIFSSTVSDEGSRFHSFSVSLLLFLIAIAVFLFIRAGMTMDSYKMLLQEKEFSMDSKKQEKKLQVIASIFWPIIVAIYLLASFVTGAWGTTWMIWPVCGILFGVFSAIYKAVHTGN